MSKWSPADLQKELAKVQSCGWMPYFEASAHALDFPSELLLAIASRETGMANVPGDFRDGKFHGFGIMQVDVGTDPEFCCTWHPDKVKESIQRATEILAEKRLSLKAKNKATTKNIASAYNAGQGTVLSYLKAGKNPDLATTGGNYGADVLARMTIFSELLAPSTAK